MSNKIGKMRVAPDSRSSALGARNNTQRIKLGIMKPSSIVTRYCQCPFCGSRVGAPFDDMKQLQPYACGCGAVAGEDCEWKKP